MMLLARRIVTLAASMLLTASTGCGTTHHIDYRRIHEPIMLNADPIVGGSPPKARVFKRTYTAEKHNSVTASGCTGTAPGSGCGSSTTKRSNLQSKAFYDVVGYKDRAITEITLDAYGWGAHMFLAASSDFTVDVTGKLIEIDRSELASHSDHMGAEQ